MVIRLRWNEINDIKMGLIKKGYIMTLPNLRICNGDTPER